MSMGSGYRQSDRACPGARQSCRWPCLRGGLAHVDHAVDHRCGLRMSRPSLAP